MKKIKVTALLLVVAVAVLLSLTGCPRALAPSILDFSDEDFASVCGTAFGKDYKRVTAEDMASVETFDILTYGEDNIVTIGFKGYYENPTEENVVSIDITGKVFDSLEDFRYFTNLKSFTSVYTTNADYSFLRHCTDLRSISISGNSECRDFEFVKGLTNLEYFSLESGTVEDVWVFSGLTNLKTLSLVSVSTKIDPDYLMEEEGLTIEELGYDETSILEIEFLRGLTNLENLTVSSNLLRDLSPVSELKNLKYVDFSYNAIDDISPLAGLTNLEFVDLTQNVITDVSPLANLDENKVNKIILDLCYGIEDYSPLDKFPKGTIQGMNP